jgi:hypothetical protein
VAVDRCRPTVVAAADARLPLTGELPELADVPWRPLVDEASLRRVDRRWTAWTIAHELPLLATAVGLIVLSPILIPVSLAALAFAWFIPDLYAAKGEDLPLADRVAHLLLALRADERGFATVANLSFSGARWRLARKLQGAARVGLQAAVSAAR